MIPVARLIGLFCLTAGGRLGAQRGKIDDDDDHDDRLARESERKGERQSARGWQAETEEGGSEREDGAAIDKNGKWAVEEMEGEGLADHQRRFFATQSPLEPPVDAVGGDRRASHQERF